MASENLDKSKRLAQGVIDVFAAVGLPGCDDETSIAEKLTEQRSRPTQPWLKNVELLRKRDSRAELLRIVYNHFRELANESILKSASQGVAVLTAAVRRDLEAMGVHECQTDHTLAGRFVADYLAEQGLATGAGLAEPVT